MNETYRNFSIIETEKKGYQVYDFDGELRTGILFLSIDTARAWVDGYLKGVEYGKVQGQIDELSRLLNLQMKAPE